MYGSDTTAHAYRLTPKGKTLLAALKSGLLPADTDPLELNEAMERSERFWEEVEPMLTTQMQEQKGREHNENNQRL